MKEIMIATANAHKIKEFKEMLEPLGYQVKSCLDLEAVIEVEETGTTFSENALIKARAYQCILKMDVISDDSGLCVDAMDGGPGVYSARFMGHDTDYALKNAAIIKNVEGKSRKAHYACVIGYVSKDGEERTFEGILNGEIACQAEGENGFGYDPIFYYPPYGMTLAKADEGMKNAVSHRAIALKKLLEFLEGRN